MKRIAKILCSLLITAFLAISTLGAAAFAAAPSTISVGSARNVETGQTITLPVNVTEGLNACMVQFAVKYDYSKLTLIDYSIGDAFPNGEEPTVNRNISGLVFLTWDSTNNTISAAGSLLNLTFVVNEFEGGETYVAIDQTQDIVFQNENFEDIEVQFEAGIVFSEPNGHSFGEWILTKAPTLTEDGEETRYCQNSGCTEYETRAVKPEIYTVSFDANGGTGAPSAQKKLKGTDLVITGATPILTGYTFVGWATEPTSTLAEYQPNGNYAADADITLYAVWEKDKVLTEDTPIIRIATAKARQSGEVEVQVSLENNPGIAGMTLRFNYDSTVMKLTSITESGLTGMVQQSESIIWSGDNDSTYTGVFLTLHFTIDEYAVAGNYPISITYTDGDIYNIDGVSVDFTVVSGAVTVENRIPGDVNGDYKVNTKDFITLMRLLAGDDVYVVPGSTDINADGIVNTKDFITLMKYLAGEDITIY